MFSSDKTITNPALVTELDNSVTPVQRVAMPYVLAYARVSTDQQAEDQQGLEQQLATLKRAGYDELYQEVISGRDPARPQFRALVDRALLLAGQGQRVEVLVVELQRFARNAMVALATVEELTRAGVVLREVAGGQVRISTAGEWLAFANRALYAEYFSRDLSERTRRGMAHKRRLGQTLNHKGLFGYRLNREKSHLEPHPDQWPIAREIVDRLLAGEAFGSISVWLLRTHGIYKSTATLRNWFERPALRGHVVYGTDNGRNAQGSEIVYDAHQPLLSQTEFEQIERMVAQRRSLWGRNRDATIYAVGPWVWCGTCGRKAHAKASHPGARYFACRSKDCPDYRYVRDRVIEAAIQEAILEAAEAIAKAMLTNDTPSPRIVALEAELEALRPLSHRAGIVAEMATIEAEIGQLKAAQGNQAASEVELRKMVQAMAYIDWRELSDQERREVYASVIERVTIAGGEVVEVRVRGVG